VAGLESVDLEVISLGLGAQAESTTPEAAGLELVDLEVIGLGLGGRRAFKTPEVAGLELVDLEVISLGLGGQRAKSKTPEAVGLELVILEVIGLGFGADLEVVCLEIASCEAMPILVFEDIVHDDKWKSTIYIVNEDGSHNQEFSFLIGSLYGELISISQTFSALGR
jgi:hypothetical protein